MDSVGWMPFARSTPFLGFPAETNPITDLTFFQAFFEMVDVLGIKT